MRTPRTGAPATRGPKASPRLGETARQEPRLVRPVGAGCLPALRTVLTRGLVIFGLVIACSAATAVFDHSTASAAVTNGDSTPRSNSGPTTATTGGGSSAQPKSAVQQAAAKGAVNSVVLAQARSTTPTKPPPTTHAETSSSSHQAAAKSAETSSTSHQATAITTHQASVNQQSHSTGGGGPGSGNQTNTRNQDSTKRVYATVQVDNSPMTGSAASTTNTTPDAVNSVTLRQFRQSRQSSSPGTPAWYVSNLDTVAQQFSTMHQHGLMPTYDTTTVPASSSTTSTTSTTPDAVNSVSLRQFRQSRQSSSPGTPAWYVSNLDTVAQQFSTMHQHGLTPTYDTTTVPASSSTTSTTSNPSSPKTLTWMPARHLPTPPTTTGAGTQSQQNQGGNTTHLTVSTGDTNWTANVTRDNGTTAGTTTNRKQGSPPSLRNLPPMTLQTPWGGTITLPGIVTPQHPDSSGQPGGPTGGGGSSGTNGTSTSGSNRPITGQTSYPFDYQQLLSSIINNLEQGSSAAEPAVNSVVARQARLNSNGQNGRQTTTDTSGAVQGTQGTGQNRNSQGQGQAQGQQNQPNQTSGRDRIIAAITGPGGNGPGGNGPRIPSQDIVDPRSKISAKPTQAPKTGGGAGGGGGKDGSGSTMPIAPGRPADWNLSGYGQDDPTCAFCHAQNIAWKVWEYLQNITVSNTDGSTGSPSQDDVTAYQVAGTIEQIPKTLSAASNAAGDLTAAGVNDVTNALQNAVAYGHRNAGSTRGTTSDPSAYLSTGGTQSKRRNRRSPFPPFPPMDPSLGIAPSLLVEVNEQPAPVPNPGGDVITVRVPVLPILDQQPGSGPRNGPDGKAVPLPQDVVNALIDAFLLAAMAGLLWSGLEHLNDLQRLLDEIGRQHQAFQQTGSGNGASGTTGTGSGAGTDTSGTTTTGITTRTPAGKGNAAPDYVTPVNATPVNATPVNATPVNAAPANASPANAAPANASPVNASPVNASPVNASPANAAPVNASPAPANGTPASGTTAPANGFPANITPANATAAPAGLGIPSIQPAVVGGVTTHEWTIPENVQWIRELFRPTRGVVNPGLTPPQLLDPRTFPPAPNPQNLVGPRNVPPGRVTLPPLEGIPPQSPLPPITILHTDEALRLNEEDSSSAAAALAAALTEKAQALQREIEALLAGLLGLPLQAEAASQAPQPEAGATGDLATAVTGIAGAARALAGGVRDLFAGPGLGADAQAVAASVLSLAEKLRGLSDDVRGLTSAPGLADAAGQLSAARSHLAADAWNGIDAPEVVANAPELRTALATLRSAVHGLVDAAIAAGVRTNAAAQPRNLMPSREQEFDGTSPAQLLDELARLETVTLLSTGQLGEPPQEASAGGGQQQLLRPAEREPRVTRRGLLGELGRALSGTAGASGAGVLGLAPEDYRRLGQLLQAIGRRDWEGLERVVGELRRLGGPLWEFVLKDLFIGHPFQSSEGPFRGPKKNRALNSFRIADLDVSLLWPLGAQPKDFSANLLKLGLPPEAATLLGGLFNLVDLRLNAIVQNLGVILPSDLKRIYPEAPDGQGGVVMRQPMLIWYGLPRSLFSGLPRADLIVPLSEDLRIRVRLQLGLLVGGGPGVTWNGPVVVVWDPGRHWFRFLAPERQPGESAWKWVPLGYVAGSASLAVERWIGNVAGQEHWAGWGVYSRLVNNLLAELNDRSPGVPLAPTWQVTSAVIPTQTLDAVRGGRRTVDDQTSFGPLSLQFGKYFWLLRRDRSPWTKPVARWIVKRGIASAERGLNRPLSRRRLLGLRPAADRGRQQADLVNRQRRLYDYQGERLQRLVGRIQKMDAELAAMGARRGRLGWIGGPASRRRQLQRQQDRLRARVRELVGKLDEIQAHPVDVPSLAGLDPHDPVWPARLEALLVANTAARALGGIVSELLRQVQGALTLGPGERAGRRYRARTRRWSRLAGDANRALRLMAESYEQLRQTGLRVSWTPPVQIPADLPAGAELRALRERLRELRKLLTTWPLLRQSLARADRGLEAAIGRAEEKEADHPTRERLRELREEIARRQAALQGVLDRAKAQGLELPALEVARAERHVERAGELTRRAEALLAALAGEAPRPGTPWNYAETVGGMGRLDARGEVVVHDGLEEPDLAREEGLGPPRASSPLGQQRNRLPFGAAFATGPEGPTEEVPFEQRGGGVPGGQAQRQQPASQVPTFQQQLAALESDVLTEDLTWLEPENPDDSQVASRRAAQLERAPGIAALRASQLRERAAVLARFEEEERWAWRAKPRERRKVWRDQDEEWRALMERQEQQWAALAEPTSQAYGPNTDPRAMASGGPPKPVLVGNTRLRMRVYQGGATLPGVTELVVPLDLWPTSGVGWDDLTHLERRAARAMDHFVNALHLRLPDGSTLRVTLEFVVWGGWKVWRVWMWPGPGGSYEGWLNWHAFQEGSSLYNDQARDVLKLLDDARGTVFAKAGFGRNLTAQPTPRHLRDIYRLAHGFLPDAPLGERQAARWPGGSLDALLELDARLEQAIERARAALDPAKAATVDDQVRDLVRLLDRMSELQSWLERFRPARESVTRAHEHLQVASELLTRGLGELDRLLERTIERARAALRSANRKPQYLVRLRAHLVHVRELTGKLLQDWPYESELEMRVQDHLNTARVLRDLLELQAHRLQTLLEEEHARSLREALDELRTRQAAAEEALESPGPGPEHVTQAVQRLAEARGQVALLVGGLADAMWTALLWDEAETQMGEAAEVILDWVERQLEEQERWLDRRQMDGRRVADLRKRLFEVRAAVERAGQDLAPALKAIEQAVTALEAGRQTAETRQLAATLRTLLAVIRAAAEPKEPVRSGVSWIGPPTTDAWSGDPLVGDSLAMELPWSPMRGRPYHRRGSPPPHLERIFEPRHSGGGLRQSEGAEGPANGDGSQHLAQLPQAIGRDWEGLDRVVSGLRSAWTYSMGGSRWPGSSRTWRGWARPSGGSWSRSSGQAGERTRS